MAVNPPRIEDGYEQGGSCERLPNSPIRDFQRDQLLIEIADRLVRARNVSELFQEMAPRILQLTGSDFLKFALHDPEQDCMISRYWKTGQECTGLDAFPVTNSLSGWVWMHQEAVVVADVETDNRFPTCLNAARQYGLRCYCALPLTSKAHRFGALGLGKNVPDVLDSEYLDFVRRLASVIATALESHEANRTREGQRDRLQGLVVFARELNARVETDQLLRVIFANARRMTKCDYASVALLEGEKKFLRTHAESWMSALATSPHEGIHGVRVAETVAGPGLELREIRIWPGDDVRQPASPQIKAMLANGQQSVCSVPLLSGGETFGALHLGCVRKDAFCVEDIGFLGEMAGLIATAFRNANAYSEITQLKNRLTKENHCPETELRIEMDRDTIIGRSPALKYVLDKAAIVAITDSTVLITGETGTGKERVAHAIHGMSRRKERSFIKINCAAIPTGLLESELFGHEKGAFTGAVSQKIGRLELADKGTLFLDEIGDIPLELQPKLLRVLQDQEFERLGGTRTIRVDVRLLAATNLDLARAVEEKEFRRDLFYRLHVFPLHLPALRDRTEDIPDLIHHFVERCSARLGRKINTIPQKAMDAMIRWSWPGNIRELENFIERSVILSEGPTLRVPLSELRPEVVSQHHGQDGTLHDLERDHIIGVLRQTRGLLSGPRGAATRLGVKRTTLQYKLQKLGISRTEYLD
jgi:formate hydrogenlyase transcriptional activator